MYLVDENLRMVMGYLANVGAVEDYLNSDLEDATTWFIQNGMKPNPSEKYQAMVVSRT